MCMYVYMYICICMHTYAYTYMFTSLSLSLYIYIYTYLHVYTHMRDYISLLGFRRRDDTVGKPPRTQNSQFEYPLPLLRFEGRTRWSPQGGLLLRPRRTIARGPSLSDCQKPKARLQEMPGRYLITHDTMYDKSAPRRASGGQTS